MQPKLKKKKKSKSRGTFLVVEWIGIHPPVQGTQVQFLVWKDFTYHGATASTCHNYWSLSAATKTQNSQKQERDLEHKMLYSLPPLWVESILMFVYESIIMFTYVFLLTVHQTFFQCDLNFVGLVNIIVLYVLLAFVSIAINYTF